MSVIYNSKLALFQALACVARVWSLARSKDPATPLGCVIYNHQTHQMFMGYNGFPKGVPDLKIIWDARQPVEVTFPGQHMQVKLSKYDLVRHAEPNAISFASQAGCNMAQCTLVVLYPPCRDCMVDHIIPSGIKHVLFCQPSAGPGSSVGLTRETEAIALVAGVKLTRLNAFPYSSECYSMGHIRADLLRLTAVEPAPLDASVLDRAEVEGWLAEADTQLERAQLSRSIQDTDHLVPIDADLEVGFDPQDLIPLLRSARTLLQKVAHARLHSSPAH